MPANPHPPGQDAHDAEVVEAVASVFRRICDDPDGSFVRASRDVLDNLCTLPATARLALARRLCPETATLVDASWQVLDDMGEEGVSCCTAAKAGLRHAMEPFYQPDEDNPPLAMQLAEAERILRECGMLAASERTP